MAPAEEKKRVKKLVVEETSAPIEGESLEQESERVEEPERKEKEEKFEAETEAKKEAPQESILVPKEEAKKEEAVEETEEKKDSKVGTIWVILLALFIIASLVTGGVLIFKAGVEKGKLESGQIAQGTPVATETPAPSSATEIKREDLKVQMLNGTGKAGVAASAKEYLEGLGYKEVDTGNADTSDFTQTVISLKDSKKDYLETLKKDLSAKYEVSASTQTLSSSSDFDAVVTVGTSIK